jgi:PilZ domain
LPRKARANSFLALPLKNRENKTPFLIRAASWECARKLTLRWQELALKEQDLLFWLLVDPESITNKAVQEGDRRKDARFSVSASAEIVELQTRTRLNGRASDLSSGGCYIDTMTPFPVGASVILTVISEKHNVHVKANVVYARAGMGMGLAFTEMTAKQKDNLTSWLHELSGESSRPQAPETCMRDIREVGEQSITRFEEKGLLRGLEELITLLRVKRILSDSEVEFLRKKLSK